MGGGFQEKLVNMLGDVGCARRFERRAIFALGLCFTTALMSHWRAPRAPFRPIGAAFLAIKIYFSRFCRW